ALDFNAPKYPWGLRTMPAARIAKIREGLRLFEGTIFWGADWGRADEMHYQIGYREGDARIANFADKLNRGHLDIFGPPQPAPAPVANEIDIEAKAAAAWIGKRLHDGERPGKDGVGRYADFENGSIYWHPAVADGKAIAVPTAIYETWKDTRWEQGPLGYPAQRHEVLPGGDVQAFQGGVIYRKGGQPGRIVHGAILKYWASLGYENSQYGWPTSNEFDGGDGVRAQNFERGSLRWHPSGVIGLLDA
ncbi:LGFP repeat-containing protein, partial [Kitasatospora sp. NPDC058184]|uniref:LGFP repeat-containing protein n=1 Tax=Kitasatospora sp. NPDC058184 TaxID=3346370 RepID=UPI0036DA73B0